MGPCASVHLSLQRQVEPSLYWYVCFCLLQPCRGGWLGGGCRVSPYTWCEAPLVHPCPLRHAASLVRDPSSDTRLPAQQSTRRRRRASRPPTAAMPWTPSCAPRCRSELRQRNRWFRRTGALRNGVNAGLSHCKMRFKTKSGWGGAVGMGRGSRATTAQTMRGNRRQSPAPNQVVHGMLAGCDSRASPIRRG